MNDAESMLNSAEGPGSKVPDLLVQVLYEELRRLAASRLAREAPGQTLQPTALVHEAWLRLIKDENRHFESRTHFLPPQPKECVEY